MPTPATLPDHQLNPPQHPAGEGGYHAPVEPIPETVEAIAALDFLADDGTRLDGLTRAAALAQRIAPDLAGISVASKAGDGLTFTRVATDEEIAALDGVQYLTAGPCVDAAHDGQGAATTSDDLLSERRWRSLGLAAAAAGIRCTLTFPIISDGTVTGTVNLYGLTDDTFEGKHEALAEVFRAWAPGAVTNADLSFSTRRAAERAPEQLRDQARIDAAVGIMSAVHDITVDVARRELERAAQRAGVPLAKLAQTVINLHNSDFT